MAQLANCPQCEHELLVPEGVVAGAWARCPSCRAFFQLTDAKSREVATLEVIESAPAAGGDDRHAVQADEDFSSTATWSGDAEDDRELHATEDLEPVTLHIAEHLDDAAPPPAELHLAEVEETEGLNPGSPLTESAEVAAERIDAWFRSANTLADVPPLEKPAVEYHTEQEPELAPTTAAANNATIDLGSGGVDKLAVRDDFELETPAAAPQNLATWDDAQHMDRLLAEIQDQPHDEYVPAGDEVDSNETEHRTEPAAEWTPDESLAIAPFVGKPRRRKSLVRTLVMTVVGGVMGLSLGYYALLWIRGPEIDFLNWANSLPKAILPASFSKSSRLLVAAPSVQPKVEETPTEPTANEPEAMADETAKTADTTPIATDSPAEIQASFTEPADATKAAAPPENPDATAATTAEQLAEPAAFDAPPAAPANEAAPPSEPIHIAGAPSFTADDLSAALEAGKGSEAGLVNGNLTDGSAVARTKGFSYSILADLAQKTTFVDAASSADGAKLQQETDELFRTTLANPHTREEVGQIVPKWIASPNRRHGGVFFAGSVVGHEVKGSVSECGVDLGGGQSLPVLLPAAFGEQLKGSSTPVAVVGWIVDKPAENVPGYTGTAPQAVFASKLVPLE